MEVTEQPKELSFDDNHMRAVLARVEGVILGPGRATTATRGGVAPPRYRPLPSRARPPPISRLNSSLGPG